MNAFAALVILSQITLQDFLDLQSNERLRMFGHLVGLNRVVFFWLISYLSVRLIAFQSRFNVVFEVRCSEMSAGNASPPTKAVDVEFGSTAS